MDIRCGSCNKLFRIADEKVSEKAVRFKCSRCGEIVLVPRREPDRSEQIPPAEGPPPQPPKADSAAPPSPKEAPQTTADSASGEYQPQEYQPPIPSAGLDDFDFSEPHAAAQSMNMQEDVGTEGTLSPGVPADQQSSGSGMGSGEPMPSINENEMAAGDAVRFPDDIISEPVRKPPFASSHAEMEEANPPVGNELSSGPSAVPEMAMPEERVAVGGQPAETQHVALDALGGVSLETASEVKETADFGRTPEMPRSKVGRETGSMEPAWTRQLMFTSGEANTSVTKDESRATEEIHPLAAGNISGAVSGIACSVPIALLILFGFGILAKLVPNISELPMVHLTTVATTGIFSLSVMIGLVISTAQAQAGKKLFFLVNVLIGMLFGAIYGAGMNIMTSLASGSGIIVAGMIGGAVSGSIMALLLSVVIVIVRRIFFFKKAESFAAPLSRMQKVGLAFSLAVILGSLYAEGTLIGRMEQTAAELQQRLDASINPDGLTVENAYAYRDPATGDLIVTGSIRNVLPKEKHSWYLEVGIYDKDQKRLATIRVLNGVQLFNARELELQSQRRGKSVEGLKAGMMAALQKGTIPPKGSRNFELHLLNPPAACASFYPDLRKLDARTAAGLLGG